MRYFRSRVIKTILLAIGSASFEALMAQEGHHEVQQLRLGPVSIAPEAFIDGIGEWRSATTLDTVWTQFGRIPLKPTILRACSLSHIPAEWHMSIYRSARSKLLPTWSRIS